MDMNLKDFQLNSDASIIDSLPTDTNCRVTERAAAHTCSAILSRAKCADMHTDSESLIPLQLLEDKILRFTLIDPLSRLGRGYHNYSGKATRGI